MFKSDSNHENEQPSFGRLESIVRAAGGYVQPTDDLRPNALEAARSACQQRRMNQRFGGLAVVILLLAACGFPGFLFSSQSASLGPAFVSSSEVHRRATQSVIEGGFGSNWALYEVFSDLRRDQADRLNPSN